MLRLTLRSTAILPLLLIAACGDQGITASENVPYDGRHGSATRMDIYSPDGASAAPAVMLVHGGSWKRGGRGDFTVTAKRLARSGYVAATIEYRLGEAGVFPAAARDVFCALAFLRAHAQEYGLDPTRVAIMGYSAGGQLVSLLGVAADDPDLQDPSCPAGLTGAPAAVIDGAGPVDLRALAGAADVVSFLGVPFADDPDLWIQASPYERVTAAAPPFLLVHAESDLVVPVSQSRRFRDRLRESGVDAHLLALPGGGHVLNEGTDLAHEVGVVAFDSPEAWLATIDFLERTLGAP